MNPALFGLRSFSFSKNPILVIDRLGLIGEPLALKLSREFAVVFVSRKKLDLDIENQNIIHIPFFRKFPAIPDNKYSHIIFIDEEGQDLEFLPKIIDKVKDVNADFIFAQGLSTKREYAVGRILRSYNSAKIVLYGDIFDNKLILRKENFRSVVNKFIYQAQKFGRMQILGEGLREAYPVFLSDVVDGLIDLVFGMHRSRSLFYIFPKYPPTELSLAHMIQKKNPEVTIDFVKHDPRPEIISYPSGGQYLLEDKYALTKKIRSIDIKKGVKIRDGSPEDKARKLRKIPLFIVWIWIFLFLSPFVFTVFFNFLGLNTFHYAKEEMNKGNFVNAKSSLHLSQMFFYAGKKTSSVLSLQTRIFGVENNFKRLMQDIELGNKISEGLFQIFNSEAYFSKVLNGKSEKPAEDFAKGEGYLKGSIIALSKIQAEEKIPAPILQNLEIVNPLMRLLSNVSDIMPNIFGMEGPKTYLILFQDNMELRPGGGLISSYGILKFNLGKVTEFSLHDTSDADKQLRGHVEPPFALRRYLPEQHWYMRDSNFDIDFANAASSSSNFLLIESGQKADGVIGVDASFIKNILHVIGQVYVGEYRETVNENNLYALMQKNNSLKPVGKAIIAKMKKEKMPYLLIAQSISDALMQKHLLFAFKDEQNIFTVNGWSSSLWDGRKNSEELVNDFVGINEANLGTNKVNYFIKRQMSQKVTIDKGGNILEELVVNYKNESNVQPGGDYKNYLRVVLPKNTKLSEISINDNSQKIVDAVTDPLVYEAKNFKTPQGLEVEKSIENNKAIFGFLVKIPVGEIVKVKLKYALAGSVSGLDVFSYNLKLFKQPGIDNIPYSFSLTYPNSFNIVKSSDKMGGEEGNAWYAEKIIEDKNLIIDFAKK